MINSRSARIGNHIWAISEQGRTGFARVSFPDTQSYLLVFSKTDQPPRLITGKDFSATHLLGRAVWSGNVLK